MFRKVACLAVLSVFVFLLFLVLYRSQPRNFVLSQYWSSANAPKWISGKEITTNVMPDTDTTKLASISGKEERETFHGPGVNVTTKLASISGKEERETFHGPGVDVTTKITKSFLYLTQTEECLPAYLLSNDTLGDPSLCNCDVIILSYKKRCQYSSHPHIQYIFDPTTTWNSGRNLLYTAAMNRTTKYLYYVLMDDDLKLAYKPGSNGSNPWRELEESVLRERPPIVGLDKKSARVQKTLRFAGLTGTVCSGDFVPTCSFDAMFNIFHHNAISHLLPYRTKYDKESWWYSSFYVHIKAGLLYGHVALHGKIYGQNTRHRRYPRRRGNQTIVNDILEAMRKEVMEQFPDRPELAQRDCVTDSSLVKCYCTGQKSLCPVISSLEW